MLSTYIIDRVVGGGRPTVSQSLSMVDPQMEFIWWILLAQLAACFVYHVQFLSVSMKPRPLELSETKNYEWGKTRSRTCCKLFFKYSKRSKNKATVTGFSRDGLNRCGNRQSCSWIWSDGTSFCLMLHGVQGRCEVLVRVGRLANSISGRDIFLLNKWIVKSACYWSRVFRRNWVGSKISVVPLSASKAILFRLDVQRILRAVKKLKKNNQRATTWVICVWMFTSDTTNWTCSQIKDI